MIRRYLKQRDIGVFYRGSPLGWRRDVPDCSPVKYRAFFFHRIAAVKLCKEIHFTDDLVMGLALDQGIHDRANLSERLNHML